MARGASARSTAVCTTASAVDIIAVVGAQPHEVRSRGGVEVVDEGAVVYCARGAEGGVRTDYLAAAGCIAVDVLEGEEPVVLVLVSVVAERIASCHRSLVLHVALPGQTNRLEPVNQIRVRKRPYRGVAGRRVRFGTVGWEEGP